MKGLAVVTLALGACASANGVGDDDDGVAAEAIHVAPDGDDVNPGTAAAPLRHVGPAIDLAAACQPACEVRIAAGTYLEPLTLAPGVDLTGGWAPGFDSRDPERHVSILSSSDERTVVAEHLDTATVLDGLTIRGADLGFLDTGWSSTALWVSDSGSAVTLRQVRVEAGRGARGTAGADGGLVECSAVGGSGGGAFDCGGDAGVIGNAGGDPISTADGGGPGASNCPDACPSIGTDGIGDGGNGGDGGGGTAGDGGVPATDDVGVFDEDRWVGAAGTRGSRGTHGTGGSGGGAGGTKRFRACFGCDTLLGGHGGDGAPGGCGGDGGAAGDPGGASFGLAIARSQVVIDDVEVIGGEGGTGGVGGRGHPGGEGGTDGDQHREPGGSQQCGAITYRSGGGGAGGHGGHGGAGGGGPGGIGGPSIAVVLVGEGELGPEDELGVWVGEGGVGGAGADDAPSGRIGRAVVRLTF